MPKFVEAYNKHTGEKLPNLVPESHLGLFPGTLSKTPSAKAADAKASSTTKKES